MATKDFRASQIETSKIIGTGSISGTTVGIAIYSGSIASNREGGTSDSAMFDNVGSDVFLFVSGTISNSDNTRTDATLFGGDVVISGTLYAERQVIEVDSVADGDFFVTGNMYVKPDTNSDVSVAFRKADGTDVLKVNTNSPNVNINGDLILTGNIHMLSDHFDGVNIETENTFELKAQSNIVMQLDSDNDSTGNGSYFGVRDGANNYKFVVYENSATTVNFDMSATTDFVVKGDTNHSAIFVDASENAVALGRHLSTDFGSESGVGTDVKILLSGTVGSRGGSTRGVTLAAGDMVISGATDLKNNLILTGDIFAAASILDIKSTGGVKFTLDSDGSSTNYFQVADSSGNEIFQVMEPGALSTGTRFNFTREATQNFMVSSDNDYAAIFVDAGEDAVALGWASDAVPHWSELTETGTDVKILLSGTVGSKDTSTRGVTLVSGDMAVSGSLTMHGGTNGKLIFSPTGQNDQHIYGSGDALYIEGDNSIFMFTDTGGYYKLYHNSDEIITKDTAGNLIINDESQSYDFRVESNNLPAAILVDGGDDTIILGASLNTFAAQPAEARGSDVRILLSGSAGTKDSATRGVTLVSGDMVVSGGLYDGSGNAIGVTINNNTDNRILTATGIDNTINGESNLEFNGSTLILTGSLEMTSNLNLQPTNKINFNTPGTGDQYIQYNGNSLTIESDNYFNVNADDGIEINVANTTTGYIDIGVGANTLRKDQYGSYFNRDNDTDCDFVVDSINNDGILFVDAGLDVVILGASDLTGQGDGPNELWPLGALVGNDVRLYFSGSAGSKGSSTRGVTLVAGDMVVSGTLYDGAGNQIGDITSVTAGSGLTGGGSSGAVSLSVGAGTGINVTSTTVSVDVSDFMTNGANNRILTATGTDAMNAETHLTFEGGSSPPELYIGGMAMVVNGVRDKFSTITSATGVTTHDCRNSLVFLHSSISANFTANFTSLNLDQDYATNITLVLTQGGTAYMSTAVQIESVAQTILWQGGLTPSGTSSGTDVVSFSIINDGGTYTVLGQSVSYS